MFTRMSVAALAAVVFLGASAWADEKPVAKKPKVEVVFCLDTTGSMGGLIEGAKARIWSICNQIAGGKPAPELKVGLVAYRDRGDEYVTRVFDLSDDLDAIHGHLKKFTANGGGDGPESVNQALHDAVHKVKWSDDKKTLKIIFLVGDAPPHMDYKDDVHYPDTCKNAVQKNIIINAIQCGKDAETTRVWKDVAIKSEGSFAGIPQDGGVVAVATPYDKELGELNGALARTTLVYGDAGKRDSDRRKVLSAATLPAAEAAGRAGFSAKSGKAASYDLLDSIKDKKVKMEEVKEAELPEELKKLKTVRERQEYLDRLEKERADINKKIIDLDKKREEFIKQEQTKKGGKDRDSFDANVLEMLRKQARKIELAY